MPVMPVINARGLVMALAFSRVNARSVSQDTAALEKAMNPLGHIFPGRRADRLMDAEREPAVHHRARVLEVTVHSMRIELHRRLARDIATDNRARFDIRGFERGHEFLDFERRVLPDRDWEAEPRMATLRRLFLEIHCLAV